MLRIISIKIKIRAKARDGRFEEKKRGENDAKHPTKIWINFLLKLEVVVFLLKKNSLIIINVMIAKTEALKTSKLSLNRLSIMIITR